jgi:hypothetical protein
MQQAGSQTSSRCVSVKDLTTECRIDAGCCTHLCKDEVHVCGGEVAAQQVAVTAQLLEVRAVHLLNRLHTESSSTVTNVQQSASTAVESMQRHALQLRAVHLLHRLHTDFSSAVTNVQQ